MALKALFSINELHTTIEPGVLATRDTPAVPPKEVIIKAGTPFYAKDEDEQNFFLKNGAAREATDSEARDLEPPKAKKAPKAADDAAKKADDDAAKKAADDAADAAKKAADDSGKSLV